MGDWRGGDGIVKKQSVGCQMWDWGFSILPGLLRIQLCTVSYGVGRPFLGIEERLALLGLPIEMPARYLSCCWSCLVWSAWLSVSASSQLYHNCSNNSNK